jgi:hypothetical protein
LLPYGVQKAYTEKLDDSPREEETQAVEPFNTTGYKHKMTSNADSLDSDLE